MCNKYYIGYNYTFWPWVQAIIRLSLDLFSNYIIGRVYWEEWGGGGGGGRDLIFVTVGNITLGFIKIYHYSTCYIKTIHHV